MWQVLGIKGQLEQLLITKHIDLMAFCTSTAPVSKWRGSRKLVLSPGAVSGHSIPAEMIGLSHGRFFLMSNTMNIEQNYRTQQAPLKLDSPLSSLRVTQRILSPSSRTGSGRSKKEYTYSCIYSRTSERLQWQQEENTNILWLPHAPALIHSVTKEPK